MILPERPFKTILSVRAKRVHCLRGQFNRYSPEIQSILLKSFQLIEKSLNMLIDSIWNRAARKITIFFSYVLYILWYDDEILSGTRILIL